MPNRITRRDFIRLSATGAASAVLAGCQHPRHWEILEPFVHPPEEQLSGVATWYASTCRQCPSGCGILVRVMNGRALKIEGNPEHPLNRGKLCARGQAGLQTLYNPDRLKGPVIQAERNTRKFQSISWEEAINKLYQIIQSSGERLAIWTSQTISGHLFDIFHRFSETVGAPAPLAFDLYSWMHGYDVMVDSNHQIFGAESLPVYDLANADVLFSFGADFLSTWLSSVKYGVAFGEFRSQGLSNTRGSLYQFEPRMSQTGAAADEWLPIHPGSEAVIAQALAYLIASRGIGPDARVARARRYAAEIDVNLAATQVDIPLERLERLADIFATAERPLAIPGSALTGQAHALSALASVQTLNLIAGDFDLPGGLVLPQPLTLPGFTRPPTSSLADALVLVDRIQAGEVQVLLLLGANPIYDLPPSFGLSQAMSKVPNIISFSSIIDETSVWADLVLPDRTYLESWGYEIVSPSFDMPILSSQQPVVEPVFDVRSAADVLLTVARGIPAIAKALPWPDEVGMLKELVGKLPTGATGASGTGAQWARFLQHGGWWPAGPPATLPAPEPSLEPSLPRLPDFQGDEQGYPFYLYLYMPSLLSDGRGASQPYLQGSPDPMTTISWQTWIELNPETARQLGVSDGDILHVSTLYGELEAPVYLYPAIRPDTIAIPLGEGHTDLGRFARGIGNNPIHLLGMQPGQPVENFAWSTLRAKLEPTGKRTTLALFENKVGVTEGFFNLEPPP